MLDGTFGSARDCSMRTPWMRTPFAYDAARYEDKTWRVCVSEYLGSLKPGVSIRYIWRLFSL